MKSLRSLAFVVFFLPASLAGTISPDSDDAQHIEYGRKFPYVARLACKASGRDLHHDGSCVLIGDKWAITAAHVVDGMDEWVVVTDDGERHVIEGVSIHEDYAEGVFGSGDIAICKSRDSFGLQWYPPLYAGRDEAGKVASIAGFGSTGTFANGRTAHGDGVRRAGSNIVDAAEGGCLICTPSRNGRTSLEFHIAPGDSGGGLFIGNRLAGVNSHVSVSGTSPPRGVFGEESAHTRVSDYLDWITKEMCRE